ncbi:MAG: uroporphyrinogen decarboxylase family protein [Armatimonadota bacterium]
MSETVRSRFQRVMAGEQPADRLPMMEWASWWNLTVERWEGEGLPAGLGKTGVKQYFGLDTDLQFWLPIMREGAVQKDPRHGGCWIENEAEYDALLPFLYPDPAPIDEGALREAAARQAAGDAVVWITLNGFFWFPRTLLGIEPHLYAFYDQPDLMHRINRDLAAYNLRLIDAVCRIVTPDFMTYAEDMSYNHGPMISKDLFDEFMAPYYLRVNPALKERGVHTLIDSDGGIEPLIPWFEGVGLEGILPLERMAGVDVNRIRANHPQWKMIGGFDKTVMHLGEERMRREFERLLPAMRSGCFIPSVDHQTPPGVSMEDYYLYLRLLKEYAEKACR